MKSSKGEAANYIGTVTEGIHDAHLDAARAQRARKRKPRIEIADPNAERWKAAMDKKNTKAKKKKR